MQECALGQKELRKSAEDITNNFVVLEDESCQLCGYAAEEYIAALARVKVQKWLLDSGAGIQFRAVKRGKGQDL